MKQVLVNLKYHVNIVIWNVYMKKMMCNMKTFPTRQYVDICSFIVNKTKSLTGGSHPYKMTLIPNNVTLSE